MSHKVLTSKGWWTVVVAMVSASVLISVSPASASKKHPSNPATWSVVQGQNVSGIWTLSGVSCPDANNCEAVGGGSDGGPTGTFVERLHDSVWSIASSPNASLPNLVGQRLTSVSCPDASDCMAVGYVMADSTIPLAEWWNGSTWSITSSTSLSAVAEPVKRFETPSYEASFAISSTGTGSLIQATVGSSGGCGRRWRNRAGLAV